jgi:hypothetical protein
MGELPEGKMCFYRNNALIPWSFCIAEILLEVALSTINQIKSN